jgi:D-glycero-alpha-D-manno-heptose 1-phosphate guanylyltransferase
MEAVILAGGLGTRIREVVPDLPKVMAPVAGRPFLELLLQMLARKGFTRVVLSVGYLSKVIVDHFGSTFAGLELTYEIEESPLGTGGAMVAALARCWEDHVFVLNGDTFVDLEVEALLAMWRTDPAPLIIAREVVDVARFGALEIEGARVLRILEKSASGPGLINAGCYLVPRNLFGTTTPTAFSFERDFLPRELAARTFHHFVTRGLFIDIGVPADYARAQDYLRQFA